jgi:hypothetical protein
LRDQKFLERTGNLRCHAFAVRDDCSRRHQVSVRKLNSGGQLMRTPNTLPMPLVT